MKDNLFLAAAILVAWSGRAETVRLGDLAKFEADYVARTNSAFQVFKVWADEQNAWRRACAAAQREKRELPPQPTTPRPKIAEGLRFDDCIGWCGHDSVHNAFPICYRQILPRRIDNLLCAGRCLGKGDTIDAFRLICPCMVTGQAAGVAAALAVRKEVTPRRLAFADLARELDRQGVYRN